MREGNPHLKTLRKQAAKLTTKPGVYRWLDAKGNVLYVGKAKNLRNRVQSYLQKDAALLARRSPPRADEGGGPWKQSLMRQVADLAVTVARSELEALILETNLIKQKKPKYNVLMKDDKNYVYARITVRDPYPRVDLVRRPPKTSVTATSLPLEGERPREGDVREDRRGKFRDRNDESLYFGPYTNATEVHSLLTLLRKVFPFRNCKMSIVPVPSGRMRIAAVNTTTNIKHSPLPPRPSEAPSEVEGRRRVGEGLGVRVVIRNRDRPTPCLDYHLKQCSAPCIGCVTPEEYHRTSIEGVIDFLKGRTEDALSLLSERMRTAARDRKFEQAAKLRDALQTIRRLSEKQIVSDTSGEDADVFGAAVELNRVHVVLLKERDGKVIDESSFTLIGHAESAGEALLEFLPQYYMDAPDVPPLIVLPEEIEGRTLLEKWLTERRGSRVAIHVPERGKKGKLLELAEENAREKVQQFETRWEVAARNVADALKELKDTLGLPTTPKRIEAFDISHLGGTETVGSMSVFIDGKPKNDQYRSFTIKTMREGEIDDYRALQEVLRRRFLHLTQNLQQEQREWKKKGIAFGKVRKNDRERILRIHKEHHREINDEDIDFARYLIARHGDDIIGFCRTVEHAGGHRELKSLWVHEDFRGQRLGQFLVRKMLAMQKKTRKVYIAAKTPLVEYYGILGFRLAHHPPQIIVRKHERAARKKGVPPGIVMVYIFAEHKKDDASLCSRPDLLLIDGGKGQLNAAQAVVKELKQQIPVIALAKKEEEIFTSGSPKPLPFPKDSPARFLLMRLRDEAHRFANQHRETRLKKRAVFSAIDALPGIGPQTKVKLLKKFGSLKAIEAASDEELSTILSQSQLKTFRNQL